MTFDGTFAASGTVFLRGDVIPGGWIAAVSS